MLADLLHGEMRIDGTRAGLSRVVQTAAIAGLPESA